MGLFGRHAGGWYFFSLFSVVTDDCLCLLNPSIDLTWIYVVI